MTTLALTASRAATTFRQPLRAGAPLRLDAFAAVRRRMVLEACKWDPQVEDVATLAPFPLLIGQDDWAELCRLAESLDAETARAEVEVMGRPDLFGTLALPRRLRAVLRQMARSDPTPAAAIVRRFDFHWTDDGWRVSEVNSDVPGGFAEASAFPRLVAEHVDGPIQLPPDPAAAWADAVHRAAGAGDVAALLTAPGFMEDQQVVAFLARRLAERGLVPSFARPDQFFWRDGRAYLGNSPLAVVVRFYQAEWLARLPRRCGWANLLVGGRTPVVNPAMSVLSESKRFPLVWNQIRTPLPTWRRLLPETRDPRDAPWSRDDGWLLKTPFSNTGDTVSARGLLTPKQWRAVRFSARLWPGQWVAQRRFHTLPLATSTGLVYPCVGVYTVDGRAAGAYVRLSRGPVVDYRAIDAALLIEPQSSGKGVP